MIQFNKLREKCIARMKICTYINTEPCVNYIFAVQISYKN